MASENTGSLVEQAQEYLLRGDAIAAQTMLSEARSKGAPRKAVAATMGRVLLALDKPVQSRRWLERGDFSPATAARGFRALAALELREGHLGAAGEAYNRALAITPKDAGLWTEIARYRYLGGEHLRAIEASDYAYALDPGNAAALQLRAELVRDREGMLPALDWFEKALDQSPDNVALLGE
ncbi:MAG: hypothetical protein KUG65_00855, partial [Sphingomonadaceae bacterium]|nr:hypothetical protein [Sphingomonadaceae bacterium]